MGKTLRKFADTGFHTSPGLVIIVEMPRGYT